MEENKCVVLFDGVCNFCSRRVNFVIRHNQKGRIKFAPLQSDAGKKILQQYGLSLSTKKMDTFILIEAGKVYSRSSAALRIAKELDGAWKLFYILLLVPPFLRNALYDFIAQNRYRWWGKNECMLPAESVKERFLSG